MNKFFNKHSMFYRHLLAGIFCWISVFAFTLVIFLTTTQVTMATEKLGRLFTTPQERNALERLRHQRPVEIVQPEIKIREKPEAEKEEQPEIGGITVKGLVYRKNGKSTAWINNSNTYEGSPENQYIQIDAKNIDPDNVVIEIPLNEKKVKLKTGETYNPEADQVHDLEYQ